MLIICRKQIFKIKHLVRLSKILVKFLIKIIAKALFLNKLSNIYLQKASLNK